MRTLSELGVARTPDRPGPGPLPPALLRALEVTVRRRIESLLAGDYRATALGEGAELALVRPYQPGDDVRRIDWNVTARTRQAHVRVYVAEQALTTWLVLDASPSMQFGTADRRKADVAEGVALAVGHLATRRGNALGLVTFGSSVPLALPPRQSRGGLLGLLEVLRAAPELEGVGPTSLGEALTRTRRLARRRAAIVIVTDFRGPRDWRDALLDLAGRHHVLAVEVRDPREQEIPDVGELWLIDPETGREVRVDTAQRRLRERFAAAADEERREVTLLLRSSGVEHITLSTSGDWLRALARFMRKRGRHR